jgi:hypothetical protein
MHYRYFVIVGEGCTNLVRVVASTTKYFTMGPYIFSMIAVFFSLH